MRANVSEVVDNILTPFDVEVEFRIPRASQKKGRARGSFAPFFRVGRRIYYRRSVLLEWIADQERAAAHRRDRPSGRLATADGRAAEIPWR